MTTPLPFFTRDPDLPLPLISLYHHRKKNGLLPLPEMSYSEFAQLCEDNNGIIPAYFNILHTKD